MVNTLENQTVVIIGGSKGFGYGTAENLLLTTKAKIVIGSSSAKNIEKSVSSLSALPGAEGRVTGYPVNVDVSESDASIAQFFEKVGTLNHLIYTAADALNLISLEDFSKEKAEKNFGIRYWSLLTAIKFAVPRMPKSADSSIVLTTGTVINRPMKGWGAAIVGPACAVEGLTRGLAVDLAPIRVNAIGPHAVPETDVWARFTQEQMDAMVKELEEKSLTGRVGRVEDIAEGYVYLVKAKFTTGQTIILDGGEHLR